MTLRAIGKIGLANLHMLVERIRGKWILVLDLEEPTLLPFLEPVVEHLRSATKRFSYYVAFKTDVPTVAGMKFSDWRAIPHCWMKYMVAADMFLSPHTWGRAPKPVLKVHLPHGHPVKFACLPREGFEHYDYHFVTGPLHKEQTELTAAHYRIARDIGIYEVGLPKSDKLMNGYYSRKTVLDGLGLDPMRKTLLYAPSWEEGLSLRAYREKLLNQLVELRDLNVIIKLHPVSCSPKAHPQYLLYTGGVDWAAVIRPYLNHSHMRHIVDSNVDPLLAASDIMLTDISGVALEFLCLSKPVIYLDCPEFYERTLPTLYREFGENSADRIRNDPMANAGRHVGIVVKDIDDLGQVVRRVLANPDVNLAARNGFAERIRYNRGRASGVAAQTIISLLQSRGRQRGGVSGTTGIAHGVAIGRISARAAGPGKEGGVGIL